MIGRLSYWANRAYSNRPDILYHRDYVRPQILKSQPLTGTKDASAEIHVLTSKADWINTIWALKSFYAQVPKRYRLAIHGDPSLPDETLEKLQGQFPDARVIKEQVARHQVLSDLSDYPLSQSLRKNNTLSLKLFDFASYLSADRMILFDSDLLFFSKPTAFLRYLEDESLSKNIFNPDIASAYSLDHDSLAELFCLEGAINSGFGIVHKKSLRMDWVEEFLRCDELMKGNYRRLEQTLYALLSSRFGVGFLPDEYKVFLKGKTGRRPVRHYVGAIRGQMYTEGMRRLQRKLLQ